MKRNALLILAAGGMVALAAWRLVPAAPQPHATPILTPATASAGAPAAVASAPGYRIQLDFNGQITEEASPADAAELKKALDQMVNTSSAGLVEVPSPVSGGGTMIDLRGRFQTSAAAVVDADGHLTAPCVTSESEVEALTGTEKKGE